MTGPRTPGWYDDPGGDVERLRWWDGAAWTPLSRERMPHERAALPPEPASWSAGDVLDTGAARPPQRIRWAWVAAVVGLGLVGVLVLRDSFQRLDGTDADASGPSGQVTLAPPTQDPTFVPVPPTTRPSRPVSGRIVDPAAGLSYSVLPGQWRSWEMPPFTGLSSTVGYYRVLQLVTPTGGEYWANVGSGPVSAAFTKPRDLPGTTRGLVDALAVSYYPKHTRRDVLEREITVHGAPGYLYQYVAAFDPLAGRGYQAKSEQVTVLVLETGRQTPAAFYVSLPDTVKDSWPTVAALIASIRILR